MRKRILDINLNTAYVFREINGCIFVTSCSGYCLTKTQMKQIATGINNAVNSDGEIIKAINEEAKSYWEEERENFRKREPKKRQIYIFRTADKYKIGVAEDYRRRLKELNDRPFETIKVFVSKPTSNAFKLEKMIHKRFKDKRVNGEWFKLTDKEVNDLIDHLSKIGGLEND